MVIDNAVATALKQAEMTVKDEGQVEEVEKVADLDAPPKVAGLKVCFMGRSLEKDGGMTKEVDNGIKKLVDNFVGLYLECTKLVDQGRSGHCIASCLIGKHPADPVKSTAVSCLALPTSILCTGSVASYRIWVSHHAMASTNASWREARDNRKVRTISTPLMVAILG